MKHQRSHVYRAKRTEGANQRQVVGHLLERLFFRFSSKTRNAGTGNDKKPRRLKLAAIRKLLDELEGEQKMNLFWELLDQPLVHRLVGFLLHSLLARRRSCGLIRNRSKGPARRSANARYCRMPGAG